MSGEFDLHAAAGFVDPSVQAEFPGLRLLWVTAEVPGQATSRELERRLRALSDRYRGASVVAMRTQPIPHAYRVFFRHIGLDPDVHRIPSEQAAVARLLQGGFSSRGPLSDALLLALLETGVPVWALDAERVDAGGLGIRTSRTGETLGAAGGPGCDLAAGRLVVADARRIHATLFGEFAPDHRPGPEMKRVALFAVGVDGVPSIHLEEAIWVSVEALRGA
jgi:DNA/RNA-binding domain of Phe-tRNA-synthetase-like protein